MAKVCSLTQRQILLRMAGKQLQSERIAAADRRATMRMNAVGQSRGASTTRRHLPLSGLDIPSPYRIKDDLWKHTRSEYEFSGFR